MMNDNRIIPLGESKLQPMPSPDDLVKMTAAVFGVIGAGPKEWVLSGGRLMQALWIGKFWPQFLDEVKHFYEQGKIKGDYFGTRQNWESLTELWEYFEKEVPNERVWEALKKIYFVAASEMKSNRNDDLPFYYMRIVRTLSPGEIEVMFAAHRIAHEDSPLWNDDDFLLGDVEGKLRYWFDRIRKATKLGHDALIEKFEGDLIDKKVATPRLLTNELGVKLGQHFHLTSLGNAICDYVIAHDDLMRE